MCNLRVESEGTEGVNPGEELAGGPPIESKEVIAPRNIACMEEKEKTKSRNGGSGRGWHEYVGRFVAEDFESGPHTGEITSVEGLNRNPVFTIM